jgi:hypothetical protein
MWGTTVLAQILASPQFGRDWHDTVQVESTVGTSGIASRGLTNILSRVSSLLGPTVHDVWSKKWRRSCAVRLTTDL